MKNTLTFFFTYLILIMLPIKGNSEAKLPPWPEKDAFHEVMSSTFHPSEEGNLQPIINRSHEMVEKAEAWMKSTPPKGYKKKSLKPKLKALYNESVELDKMVKNHAPEADIKVALSKLHDRFHEIVEICRNEPHGEQHHGH